MKFKRAHRVLLSTSLSVFLAGCGAPNYSQSEMHFTVEEVDAQKPVSPESRPALVKSSPTAPVLTNARGSDTFDVVVTNIPTRDLLFALARDAGINMDIDDRVGGVVSLSALDQTLDAILERIASQVDIRVDRVGEAIVVKPDLPYYKQYNVDFLNITRSYTSDASASGIGDGSASVSNAAESDLWADLEEGLETILEVEIEGGGGSVAGAVLPGDENVAANVEGEARYGTESSYNLNVHTGVLIVYAPDRLQKEVELFLDRSIEIATRQVLLEATVVEVVLSNQYAQGIDWTLFNSLAEEGLSLYQGNVIGGAATALNVVTKALSNEFVSRHTDRDVAIATYREQLAEYERDNNVSLLEASYEIEEIEVTDAEGNTSTVFEITSTFEGEQFDREATRRRAGGLVPAASAPDANFFTAAYRGGDISAAVQLLDQFGDSKVLSSPRISALNHQPALLRVVDQEVYFNFEVTDNVNPDTGLTTSRDYEVTENTVDVGFVMNVLPFISSDNEIILNLKPAVTRVLDYRRAPIPASFGGGGSAGVDNFVPITRIRELESIISLRDGEIAVLGGLLEDRTGDDSSGVPGLSRLPGIGALFENKRQQTFKTEFVVFIRARIINNPSINGDYADYRNLLPDTDLILRGTEDTLVPPDQESVR